MRQHSKRVNGRVNYHLPQPSIYEERRQKFYGPNRNIPDPTPQSQQIQLIKQSRLTGYYQTMKTIRALKEKGSISAQKKKIQEKIKRYFLQQAGVDYGSNSIPLNHIDYQTPFTKIETNALVIHNIQMMSRKSAVVYMRYFEPVSVIFLSHNQMKIVFDTQEIAERALYAYKHNSNILENPSPPRYSNDPFKKGACLSKQHWYELIPYSVFGIQIPLFGRFATNRDIKNQTELQNGMYQRIRNMKIQLKQKAMNTNKGAQMVFKRNIFPRYFQDAGNLNQNPEDGIDLLQLEQKKDRNEKLRRYQSQETKRNRNQYLRKRTKVSSMDHCSSLTKKQARQRNRRRR